MTGVKRSISFCKSLFGQIKLLFRDKYQGAQFISVRQGRIKRLETNLSGILMRIFRLKGCWLPSAASQSPVYKCVLMTTVLCFFIRTQTQAIH
jgi:hypothetical protein